MTEEQQYNVTWEEHLAMISLLDEAPEWQLNGFTAFAEHIAKEAVRPMRVGIAEWLAAYRALDRATVLHLGYALRQRGGTGARILAEQHGGKVEFCHYVAVCQMFNIQLPEGM